MSSFARKKYPTAWQRKMMWASLTAFFVVVLVGIVGGSIWVTGKLIGFLQPILIPVAIAIILTYLLDPVVTHLSERRMSRTKAIALIFTVGFLALAALLSWIVPLISGQSAALTRELPNYTLRARDSVVDLIYRYNSAFAPPPDSKSKAPTAVDNFMHWLLASPTPIPRPAPDSCDQPMPPRPLPRRAK